MNIKPINKIIFLIVTVALASLSSCQRYRQNIMFTTEGSTFDSLSAFLEDVNTNYKLKSNDFISLKVYTSNGEALIDPEQQLEYSNSIGGQRIERPKYLIDNNGEVKLPLVGKVNVEGLTLLQTDSLLSTKYNDFYGNSYVLTKSENRRVIVLGGSFNTVIPIENENTSLLEVLALSGGVDNNSKATNIRLIRGDLSNPSVQIIDLSTIDGMRRANLKVQNNDVIYIEPVRRVVSESIRELSPILGFITSIITFSVVIINLRN